MLIKLLQVLRRRSRGPIAVMTAFMIAALWANAAQAAETRIPLQLYGKVVGPTATCGPPECLLNMATVPVNRRFEINRLSCTVQTSSLNANIELLELRVLTAGNAVVNLASVVPTFLNGPTGYGMWTVNEEIYLQAGATQKVQVRVGITPAGSDRVGTLECSFSGNLVVIS